MSNQFIAGTAIGGLVGSVAGLPGALVGSALGGLVGHAYSKKPSVENHATTVQNDLAPENVTLDGHQIYVRITTGPGPATLRAASDTATKLSDRFAKRANQIAAAHSATTEAWQGDASAAAVASAAPLSDSFTMAQEQLATTSQALDTAVTAFDHIHSQVEPVPATPPQSGIANAVNPFQTDVDAAINAYNAKAAKNVQLYEAYSADIAAVRSQVPQSYAEPAPLMGSATAFTRTASPIGAASASSPLGGSAADAGQPAATNASAAPGGTPSASPSPGGASGTPGGGTAGQGTAATDSTARQTPSTTTPIATTPGAVPALPPARDTFAAGPLAGQPRPAGASDIQRKLTGAGPGMGGAGGTGAFGVGAGVPAIDPGGAYTRGGTGTGGGAGMRGSGSAVGTGPVPGQTPPGNGQPAGRGGFGGPAARGAAGMGGMPMGAAGRGNGDEDQEYRRKYLIEPNDDELFGLDEQYPPPVIGDER
jgi:hypothetical protein